MYSRNLIKKAGKTLRKKSDCSQQELLEAENVLTYWRTIHGKVMTNFYEIVRSEVEKINSKAVVVQRLKRCPSIAAKLNRYPDTQLTTIQDIAGIRAIMKDMKEVEQLRESLKKYAQIHEFKTYDNYITNPKTSGYRSIHLIFRYIDENDLERNGLLIEIQIRTELQHSWATAVETMGAFLGSNLKFGEGQNKWLKYFALTSNAFSYIEGTPQVPGYNHLSKEETFKQAVYEYNYNQIEVNLSGFVVAVKEISKQTIANAVYYILNLDLKKLTLNIIGFPLELFESANREYTKLEKQYSGNNDYQVVLVSIESINELKEAYPNYFLDTKVFLSNMDKIKTDIKGK
jgi:putative GTP pyrophosphokinase